MRVAVYKMFPLVFSTCDFFSSLKINLHTSRQTNTFGSRRGSHELLVLVSENAIFVGTDDDHVSRHGRPTTRSHLRGLQLISRNNDNARARTPRL